MQLRDELFILLEEKSDRIEESKTRLTRTWNYQRVDHFPVLFTVDWLPWERTYREEFSNAEIQLRNLLYRVEQSLKLIPEDYIPSVFLDVGCVGIAQALGGKIFWGDDPNQTPGIQEPLLSDRSALEDFLSRNPQADFSQGITGEYLKRLRDFVTLTQGKIYVSGLDLNGPMGIAMDLLGSSFLFDLLVNEDVLLLTLLEKLTQTILDYTETMIHVAGSIERFTSLDFFYFFCPHKAHVSSDLSAMYSPRYFDRIERPFLERILAQYGGGLLHNCGPNPCTASYASMKNLWGLNLSYCYSSCDLPLLKKFMRGKVLYFFMDAHDPLESLADFRTLMEVLAPEVIALPIVSCQDPSVEVVTLFNEYRTVATEYARRVFG